MKKTILALAVMMTTGLASAFANKAEDINKLAVAAFQRDFTSATNVSWEQQKNYTKATFSINNNIMFAYYNQDGGLLAVVRNVLSDQLPISLQVDLKKKIGDYWISDLFEMARGDQNGYYVTLENSREKVVLKSDDNRQWTVYKREKKNYIDL